jgi:putative transposase
MVLVSVKRGKMFGLTKAANFLLALTETIYRSRINRMADSDTITRIYEFKIRPNKSFVLACENVLTQCQRLYNACLQQRISLYNYTGKSISWIEQCQQVTELREEFTEHRLIPRNIQTDVVKRLDKAYQAFFRRLKCGEKAGFPRYRSRDRYNSFEYAVDQRHSFPLIGNKLRVAGVGTTRVKVTREIQGQVKIIRIVKRASGWFAQLVCTGIPKEILPKTDQSIGLDVGLEKFATLSNGEQVDNPRYAKKAQSVIANAQRVLSRKVKGSNTRKKAKAVVAKAHARIANQRKDFAFKLAKDLVNRFDIIAVEKLNIKSMAKDHFAKQINDASWGNFTNALRFKAECAKKSVVEVNPKYTSQDCSNCSHRQKITLTNRVYLCPKCGLSLNRDHNAAINILRRGTSLLAEKLARKAVSQEIETNDALSGLNESFPALA